MNVSSINKPIDCRSYSTFLSTSSQISIDTDIPRIHNSCPHYFYNSHHHPNMVDSLKTMNQKLLRSKDSISPTVFDLQKKFAKLLTMDILIIGAAFFNTLIQRASHAKNIEILVF